MPRANLQPMLNRANSTDPDGSTPAQTLFAHTRSDLPLSTA